MALALRLLSARRPRRVEVVKTAAPPPAAHAAAHFAAARSQRGDEDVVLNQKRMVFFWKGNPLPNQHSTPFSSSPTLGETSLFHRGVHIVRRCSTKSTDWIRQKLARFFGTRKPARRRRRSGEVPAHGRPVATCKETTLAAHSTAAACGISRPPSPVPLSPVRFLRSAQTGTTTA